MRSALARYATQQSKLCDQVGREFAGFFNDSAGQKSSRAVIVAHDFFGLTPQIRSVASRLAHEGFLAFAPDFYRGPVAATAAEAAVLARSLNWKQLASELGLIVSALKHRREGMRVAVLGFAMGGAAALVAAAAIERLDAAVTFYGIPQDVSVENPRLRVQGHFASRDVKCTPERVTALVSSLASHNVNSEIHRYDADNGFFNPLRSGAYSPDLAKTAWDRTLQFLSSALA
jgi:carboxymethylenebutenolidase